MVWQVKSVVIAQLEDERKRSAIHTIVKATRQYLRWRNGEKWT